MKMRVGTRQAVYDTADALLKEGIKPTQQNVRERIGSGSLTTINRALNEWWEQLAQRMQQPQRPEIPEAVLSLAGQAWDRALAYAEQQYQTERQGSFEREASLRRALDAAEQQAQVTLHALQAQQAELMNKYTRLLEEKQQLDKEHSKLERELFTIKTSSPALVVDPDTQDALIEARVTMRIQDEEIQRLKLRIEHLLTENIALKQRLSDTR